jgi:predicted phage-related endonuclease
MKTHTEKQGTAAWQDLRDDYDTASEAPAMMGVSKHTTRTELLTQKKSGVRPAVTPSQQFIFDKGHRAEAGARPILERALGEDLFPEVLSEGDLLASLDGRDIAGSVLFEHKLWNDSLAAAVRAGELDPHYYWQLEQQLLVSGADKVIFVCSDGTAENWAQMEYRAVPGRAKQLVDGWAQFKLDLSVFVPAEAVVTLDGKIMDAPPAISIELTGMVTYSNLAEFERSVTGAISAVKKELVTDQDFADAKLSVKWCTEAEAVLKAAKTAALNKTADLAELYATIDRLIALAAKTRIDTDKQIKSQDVLVKTNIKQDAERAFADHCATINARLGRVTLPPIAADFAGAMKNKRNLASIRDAVDSELARVKIEANAIAEGIDVNLAVLRELSPSHIGLFRDAQQIITKASDDFALLVKSRIAEHDAEVKRLADQKADLERMEAARIAALPPVVVAPVVEPVSEPLAAQPAKPFELVKERTVEQTRLPLKAAAKTRPSDDEILRLLALHYRVHESTVIEWIITMDMDSANRRALEAM